MFICDLWYFCREPFELFPHFSVLILLLKYHRSMLFWVNDIFFFLRELLLKWPMCRFGHHPNRIMLSLCLVWVWEGGTRLDWSQLWVSARFSLVSQAQTSSFLCPCQMQHCSEPSQWPDSCSPHALCYVCRFSSSHLVPISLLTFSVEFNVPVKWFKLCVSLVFPLITIYTMKSFSC